MQRIFMRGRSDMQVIRLPFWAIALTIGALAFLVLTLLTFAAGLALILVPVAAIGAGLAKWFGVKTPKVQRHAKYPDAIDVEFRVIEPKKDKAV